MEAGSEERLCYRERDPGMELYPHGPRLHLARAVLLKQCAMFHRVSHKYLAGWGVEEFSVFIYRKHQNPIINVRVFGDWDTAIPTSALPPFKMMKLP